MLKLDIKKTEGENKSLERQISYSEIGRNANLLRIHWKEKHTGEFK